MSVANLSINNCKYSIPRLEKAVYLVSKDCIGVIDAEAYIIDKVGSPLKVDCYSISMGETEELNERYRFSQSISFSVKGYMNLEDMLERYHVVVQDKNDVYWLLNPQFPIRVNYTYTVDSSNGHTDFTLSTVSDYPLMKINEFIPWSGVTPQFIVNNTMYKWVDVEPASAITSTTDLDTFFCENYDEFECMPYSHCPIEKIALNETMYSSFSNGFCHFTNDGFKFIDFMKNSASFQEQFDGDRIVHSLKFRVPFEGDDSAWHNKLLEFQDNKYCTIISTRCGGNIGCGFQHGLMPSYTIAASTSEDNYIEITLQDLHDQGKLIYTFDTIGYSGETATTWDWVEGEFECVDNHTAKHLLEQEFDIYGNKTNKYKCLEGYESRYAYLGDALIGTFEHDDRIYYNSGNVCYGTECSIQTNLEDMTFKRKGTRTFSIKSWLDDWSISSSTSAITVSPLSGTAYVDYELTVTNTETPTATTSHTLTVTFCGGSSTIDYTVTLQSEDITECFPQGGLYEVEPEGKTMIIPCNTCVRSAVSDVEWVNNIQIQDGYISLIVDANTVCSDVQANRQGNLTCTMCDSTESIPHVHVLQFTQDGWNCNGTMLECNYTSGRSYSASCGYSTEITNSMLLASQYDIADLTAVTIGDCATSIGQYCFLQAENLVTLDIGRGVTEIGYDAFGSLVSLSSMTLHADVPPVLNSIILNSITAIYVPCLKVNTYKAASGWSDYASKIQPIEDSCANQRQTSGTPYCEGYNKYQDVYDQITYDEGVTWETTATTKVLLAENSEDCGYVPPTPIVDYSTIPLTFIPLEPCSFSFAPTSWLNNVAYSTDDGSTWSVLMTSGDSTPIFQAGERIIWNGVFRPKGTSGSGYFSSSGRFKIEGNAMSLVNGLQYQDYSSITARPYLFKRLFASCNGLINCENMVMPATDFILSEFCYAYMFQDCTNLEKTPRELPCTALTEGCYQQMFQNCTKITKSPILSASTLVEGCYQQMFRNCTNLNKVTCLATDISASNCTTNWLANVASSGEFKTPSSTNWSSGANGIPNNWTRTNI